MKEQAGGARAASFGEQARARALDASRGIRNRAATAGHPETRRQLSGVAAGVARAEDALGNKIKNFVPTPASNPDLLGPFNPEWMQRKYLPRIVEKVMDTAVNICASVLMGESQVEGAPVIKTIIKLITGVVLIVVYIIYFVLIAVAWLSHWFVVYPLPQLFVKLPIFIMTKASNDADKRKILQNFFTTFLKLIPFLVIFNLVGIWFAPLYGLAACIAYALFAQIQLISFTLFGTKNSKFIKEHIKTNRFGLTLLASIMITFSSAKNLRKETAFGVSIASIISMLILACAV